MTLTEALGAPPPTPQSLAELIWPYRNPITNEIDPNPTFEDYLKWLDDIARKAELLKGLNMPRTFIPRPYQVEGALFLRTVIRGMLYDQPGLGKTLQAAMALKLPAVISCPGYLVDQWCDFLEDQYPQWKVARINSLLGRAQRQALLDTPHDIWVVNHEMFASRREPFQGGKRPKQKDFDSRYAYKLADAEWMSAYKIHLDTAKKIGYHWPKATTFVIDESHHMRNKTASQSENAATYADTCSQVILLTASPQYRDVRDWWHQLRIMDPQHYTSQFHWFNYYCYLTGWNDSIVKVRPRLVEQLKADIAKVAIGRTYDVVGLFLPDLIEKVVKVNWHADLKKSYNELKQRFRIKTNNGYDLEVDPAAVLHLLRMMTANPEKIDAVKKIIEDVPDSINPETGEATKPPIIVFCWYRDTAALCEEEFAKSPSSVEITGAYTQKERLSRATELSTRVKCVTMASMSEGVDWSEASTVIFMEEDYTPGKIYQALSRVRRHSTTGKKEPILVYYVHVKDSVDEAIHESVTERQGDVRRILRRALK